MENKNELQKPPITIEEWERLKTYRQMIDFDGNQQIDIVAIARKYVNPYASFCASCKQNFNRFKQELYNWYTSNFDKYEAYFYPKIEEKEDKTTAEMAAKEIKNYKNEELKHKKEK